MTEAERNQRFAWIARAVIADIGKELCTIRDDGPEQQRNLHRDQQLHRHPDRQQHELGGFIQRSDTGQLHRVYRIDGDRDPIGRP